MTDVAVISTAAATLAGLAGSGHCLAMCGGMAGALGLRATQSAVGARRIYNASLYHVGRLSGYSLAGAMAGLIGSSTQLFRHELGLVAALRIASGILMFLVAARIACRVNLLGALERLGSRFWIFLRPLAIRQASNANPQSSLLLGFLWGWLPCGLVYSMLLFAAMSQSALLGAAILFSYGVGTLPSMLGASVFAGQLQRAVNRPTWRMTTAALLVAFGVWTVIAAVLPSNHFVQAFCLGS
ncbi:MAG: sulfite exporter TauE/SafE family protein [Povalibacter sp.]